MEELGLARAERREPGSVELTRHLLDYLLSGQFEPGQRIPSERQLAQALAIGRGAVRDALRPLAAFGLLDVRVGDGTYLTEPSTDLLPRLIEWGMLVQERQILDLIEVRWHLEVATAKLAAERRTDEETVALREKLSELAGADTPETFSRADTAFHLYIASISGNIVLAGMLKRIETLLRVWILRVQTSTPQRDNTYREHIPIFDAIAAGDADAAVAAMGAHLTGATQRLRAALGVTADTPVAADEPTPAKTRKRSSSSG